MLNDPKILVMDEPTAGLDPGERVRFRNFILEFSHEDIAPDEVEQYLSIPANGAVRWPATKWIPIPVRKNALPLLTAAVSTQNRSSEYTYHGYADIRFLLKSLALGSGNTVIYDGLLYIIMAQIRRQIFAMSEYCHMSQPAVTRYT